MSDLVDFGAGKLDCNINLPLLLFLVFNGFLAAAEVLLIDFIGKNEDVFVQLQPQIPQLIDNNITPLITNELFSGYNEVVSLHGFDQQLLNLLRVLNILFMHDQRLLMLHLMRQHR